MKILRALPLLLILAFAPVAFAQEPAVTDSATDTEAQADVKTADATEAVAEAKVSVVAAAVEAAKSDTAPGIGWIPKLLGLLSIVVLFLTKFDMLIPSGYRTYSAIGVVGLNVVISALTELSATGRAVTVGAVVVALVGAVIARRKTGQPA